jgi:benzoate transport
MSRFQIIAVGLTIGLNALDGFDVLSISFASPGIADEWGIDRAALGIVLSMELIGMAIGSMFLGGVADKIGRRPTMLGCLVVMAVGMFMVTTSNGVLGGIVAPVIAFLFAIDLDVRLTDLSIWRIITGLGIGGMLAAINAVAAEFSNYKRRDLSVALMSIGYPIGAVVGGMITAQLLQGNDWRSIFYFGSAVTLAFIPLVYFYVPESVHWLTRKQPAGALEKINHTLKRMGHAAVPALPVISAENRKRSVGDIFGPALLATTICVTAAYFFHITTFYFILKWVPKIVVDMGFVASSAAGVLVWANVGGATGGAVVGLLTQRYNVKAITIAVMLLSTVMVILFGQTGPDLVQLSMICAAAGFCTNGAITGMYAIFAKAFPTHVRAFGTGFAIGIGRGGSVLAPIIAGFLFTGGLALQWVAFVMALGSLVAAGVLMLLKLKPETPEGVSAETREDLGGEFSGAVAAQGR